MLIDEAKYVDAQLLEIIGGRPTRGGGAGGAEFDLAPNMVGAEFLLQTSVLPRVDLAITHDGNDTVTESFVFGSGWWSCRSSGTSTTTPGA